MKTYKYILRGRYDKISVIDQYEIILIRSEREIIKSIIKEYEFDYKIALKKFLELEFISILEIPEKIKTDLFWKIKFNVIPSSGIHFPPKVSYRSNNVKERSKMDNKDKRVGSGGSSSSSIRYPKKNKKGAWKKFRKLFDHLIIDENGRGGYEITRKGHNEKFVI